jgi:hypothetical protein
MNPFEMVVLIVAITAVASIFRAKYGVVRRGKGEEFVGRPDDSAETLRMREEIRALRDRVAVLERIATDNNRGQQLDREIEALRHRD